jgi:hypothetical protein
MLRDLGFRRVVHTAGPEPMLAKVNSLAVVRADILD